MLPTRYRHRARRCRDTSVEVHRYGGVCRRSAAGHQSPVDVIDGGASVTAIYSITVAERCPRPGTGEIQLGEAGLGSEVGDLSVRRLFEPAVHAARGLRRRRTREGSQHTGRAPNFRCRWPTTGYENAAVGCGCCRRVPTSLRHQAFNGPRVRRWVERVRLRDAVQCAVGVSSGEEHEPLHCVDQCTAEQVVSGLVVDTGEARGCRVPYRCPSERVIWVRLGWPVTDGVVGQHLPIGQKCRVNGNDRPRLYGTPRSALGSGQSCRSARCRCRARPCCCSPCRVCFSLKTRRSSDQSLLLRGCQRHRVLSCMVVDRCSGLG